MQDLIQVMCYTEYRPVIKMMDIVRRSEKIFFLVQFFFHFCQQTGEIGLLYY